MGGMNPSHQFRSSADLALRWGFKHPSSIPRLMARFGIAGVKFGKTKQAARRFALEDVIRVEQLMKATKGSISPL